jgi:hypothetical protein
MKKNLINEINSMRNQMGLPFLSESEIIDIEVNELLKEGVWENIKYFLSKLGRYKAGGKIFGKSQTDANALAKITKILDQKGNETIKQLDTSIKEKNPEFPNNKSQEKFLDTVLEIATIYDSVVSAAKLKPGDNGYLELDAANTIIEGLREYTQKYLDVDLTAAFSIFNESDKIEKELTDKEPNDIKVLDYGDPHKTKKGFIDNPMPAGTGFANENNRKIKGQEIKDKFSDTKSAIKKGDLEAYKSERIKTLKSWKLPLALIGAGASFGAVSWLVHYIFPPEEITKLSPEEIKTATEEVLGNIQPNEGTTQILNRILKINLTPNSSPQEFVDAISKIGGGDPQKGVEIMTQNGGMYGKNAAAAKQTLMAIVTNPTEKGDTLKEVFKGTWAGTGRTAGDTLVTVTGGQLSGIVTKAVTNWVIKTTTRQSAKALIAAPILKTLGIALLSGGLVVAMSRYKGRKSSRAQILNDLVQYIRPVPETEDNPKFTDKGDNIPTAPEDGNVDSNKGAGNSGQGDTGQGSTGQGQSGGKDTEAYNLLKKYFQDIFNFSGQVNRSTYGTGGTPNQQKTYSGGGGLKTKVTQPDDITDIIKLMEYDSKFFEVYNVLGKIINESLKKPEGTDIVKHSDISAKGAAAGKNDKGSDSVNPKDISRLKKLGKSDEEIEKIINRIKRGKNDESLGGVDANELKLFKKHITRLTQLIKVFKSFTTTDKDLQRVIDRLKNNPIFNKEVDEKTVGIDVNKLLKSDPKSLKIFISNFNKAIYSTNVKKGVDIMDSIKNLNINKLKESTEKTPSKSEMNAVFNTRREFLQNLPKLIKGFYDVFVYLINLANQGMLSKQTTKGGSGQGGSGQGGSGQGGSGQGGSGQGGSGQGGSGQGGSGQGGSGLNAWDWDKNDKKTWTPTEEGKLMENIKTHDNLLTLIENVIKEKLTQQMDQAKSDAISVGESGSFFSQLAKVVPELSNKISNEYKSAYGQQLNRIKLATFLETIFNALSVLPNAKMISLINKSEISSASAYRNMIRSIKTPDEEETQTTDKEEKGDVKVSDKEEKVSGNKTPQFNPSSPEKFTPDVIDKYDLSKMKMAVRTALAQKAIQVISRTTDLKLDGDTMIGVMTQLLDDIDKSGKREIPKV